MPTILTTLYRPLNPNHISEGQAVTLHKNFLGYSGQQMKPLWGEILYFASAAGNWVWLCPRAAATAAEIPSARMLLGMFDQEAQTTLFNCAF